MALSDNTASMARGVSKVEYWLTTLLLGEVEADFTRESRSESSTGTSMTVKMSATLREALWRVSERLVGWKSWERRREH